MLKKWFAVALWKRILAALALGAVFGLSLPDAVPYVKPFGDVFLNAIRMLIIPLLVGTLVAGVASIGNINTLGRLGSRTFAVYLLTTAVAISIGLATGSLFQPGAGLELEDASRVAGPQISLLDRLVSIVPRNPLQAMVEGDVLPVILFSILFGIGIVLAGKKAALLAEFFESVSQVMFKLTLIVMELAPFGVFALIADVLASVGLSALLPLAKLVVAVCVACLLHIAIVYGGLLKFAAGFEPIRALRGMLDAQVVAFTTTSSSATLPVTLSCATRNLGVDRSTASFVLPLGATINMDGTALYMGVAALFAAQAYGIDLAAADYGAIVLTATLASIGTAGVPGAGLIMMSIVFAAGGLPLEAIGLIAGVDRFLDMFRTATNVTGDMTVSVLMATVDTGPKVAGESITGAME